MVDYFLSVKLSIFYFLANRLTNISTDIQNINTIVNLYLSIMSKLKFLQLLWCWFIATLNIDTLQNIISLLCFKIICNFFISFLNRILPHNVSVFITHLLKFKFVTIINWKFDFYSTSIISPSHISAQFLFNIFITAV